MRIAPTMRAEAMPTAGCANAISGDKIGNRNFMRLVAIVRFGDMISYAVH
ncbi:hypothetical protein [Nostoc sp. DedSLP04]|nr:hypothetical protein [Nostoc sp. DedSLP04]MDZ8034294.1 hypothetical protein [Nostoc sp. DedSLP04]